MEKQQEIPQLFTYAHDLEAAKMFSARYALRKIIEVDKWDKRELVPKEKRICRFCDKQFPYATFNKKAHSISELLGNKHLFNDFECDSCNAIFSTYETHFGQYLLTTRTLYGTRGKKGIPKVSLNNRTKSILNKGDGVINFIDKKIDVNTEGITFEVKKSYTPILVYKALLKIALTLIASEDFLYYKHFVRSYMLAETNDAELGPLAKLVGVYEVDRKNKVDHPKCIIYQKKSADTKIPFHVFSLYYENFIFLAPIPLHVYDWNKGFYESMKVMIPPALLFSSPKEGSKADFKRFDFSSTSKETKIDKLEINFKTEELRSIIENANDKKLLESFHLEAFDLKLNL